MFLLKPFTFLSQAFSWHIDVHGSAATSSGAQLSLVWALLRVLFCLPFYFFKIVILTLFLGKVNKGCISYQNQLHLTCVILISFNTSFIESVMIFCILCYHGNANISKKNLLSKIVNIISKIIGSQQSNLSNIYRTCSISKVKNLLLHQQHPLFICSFRPTSLGPRWQG